MIPPASPHPAPVAATEQTLQATARLAAFFRLRERTAPMTLTQVKAQCRAIVDQVMGEAGLYAPEHAALALLQAEGDVAEAVVILRAYRQSVERKHVTEVIDTGAMRMLRRISSAFREIPGGQILGPTRDYSQRLLEASLAHETEQTVDDEIARFHAGAPGTPPRPVRTFSKVTSLLRKEGLLRPANEDEDRRVQDITREPVLFPAPRSARLQALARGSTGALMALAYSGMRGQGGDHPTIGEVRVGYVALHVTDARGRKRYLGQIQVTEAENISKIKVKKKDPIPYLSLGYGLCFGQNETKAICMGMLDRSMRIGGDGAPAISQEFVLYHTEPADAWGSIQSAKLPEHVGFMSELDHLRSALARKEARASERAEQQARNA